jgi:hypothetical protein
MVTREEAATACKEILGSSVYFAMRQGRISLPRILESTAIHVFVYQLDGTNVHTIRSALLQLEEDGVLE